MSKRLSFLLGILVMAFAAVMVLRPWEMDDRDPGAPLHVPPGTRVQFDDDTPPTSPKPDGSSKPDNAATNEAKLVTAKKQLDDASTAIRGILQTASTQRWSGLPKPYQVSVGAGGKPWYSLPVASPFSTANTPWKALIEHGYHLQPRVLLPQGILLVDRKDRIWCKEPQSRAGVWCYDGTHWTEHRFQRKDDTRSLPHQPYRMWEDSQGNILFISRSQGDQVVRVEPSGEWTSFSLGQAAKEQKISYDLESLVQNPRFHETADHRIVIYPIEDSGRARNNDDSTPVHGCVTFADNTWKLVRGPSVESSDLKRLIPMADGSLLYRWEMRVDGHTATRWNRFPLFPGSASDQETFKTLLVQLSDRDPDKRAVATGAVLDFISGNTHDYLSEAQDLVSSAEGRDRLNAIRRIADSKTLDEHRDAMSLGGRYLVQRIEFIGQTPQHQLYFSAPWAFDRKTDQPVRPALLILQPDWTWEVRKVPEIDRLAPLSLEHLQSPRPPFVDRAGVIWRGLGARLDKDGKIQFDAPPGFCANVFNIAFQSSDGLYFGDVWSEVRLIYNPAAPAPTESLKSERFSIESLASHDQAAGFAVVDTNDNLSFAQVGGARKFQQLPETWNIDDIGEMMPIGPGLLIYDRRNSSPWTFWNGAEWGRFQSFEKFVLASGPWLAANLKRPFTEQRTFEVAEVSIIPTGRGQIWFSMLPENDGERNLRRLQFFDGKEWIDLADHFNFDPDGGITALSAILWQSNSVVVKAHERDGNRKLVSRLLTYDPSSNAVTAQTLDEEGLNRQANVSYFKPVQRQPTEGYHASVYDMLGRRWDVKKDAASQLEVVLTSRDGKASSLRTERPAASLSLYPVNDGAWLLDKEGGLFIAASASPDASTLSKGPQWTWPYPHLTNTTAYFDDANGLWMRNADGSHTRFELPKR